MAAREKYDEAQVVEQLHDPKLCKTAFGKVIEHYSSQLYWQIRRMVIDHDDANDVLQDSFVRILTSVGKFKHKGEGSLMAWVARITTNCAIDWLKYHQRLQITDNIPDEIDENEEMEIHGVPPDVLNRMIGRLPMGSRTVLNLFVFEQMSHKEISNLLGISEKASYSRLFHAKKLLRTMIIEYLNSQRI